MSIYRTTGTQGWLEVAGQDAVKSFKPFNPRIESGVHSSRLRPREKGIVRAYREHGYRMREIAAHLGVHYATVSRRLKQLEQENRMQMASRNDQHNHGLLA
jgi:DNA-binding MarR family transcriptional regulator